MILKSSVGVSQNSVFFFCYSSLSFSFFLYIYFMLITWKRSLSVFQKIFLGLVSGPILETSLVRLLFGGERNLTVFFSLRTDRYFVVFMLFFKPYIFILMFGVLSLRFYSFMNRWDVLFLFIIYLLCSFLLNAMINIGS